MADKITDEGAQLVMDIVRAVRANKDPIPFAVEALRQSHADGDAVGYARGVQAAAAINPSSLDITADQMPHTVWVKYRNAILALTPARMGLVMGEHTPTPWSYSGDEDGDFVLWSGDEFVSNLGAPVQEVSDDPRSLVAFDIDHANAEFIVRAVNSHERLVAELSSAKVCLEEAANILHRDFPSFADNVLMANVRRIDEALAAARTPAQQKEPQA